MKLIVQEVRRKIDDLYGVDVIFLSKTDCVFVKKMHDKKGRTPQETKRIISIHGRVFK